MNDCVARKVPTSTAATPQTEPEVIAAISSGDGRDDMEQAIRERAYAIWEEEGRPNGHHLARWQRAEAEVNSSIEEKCRFVPG